MAEQTLNEVDRQTTHIKGVIEALLFVNEKPVTLDQLKKVLETVPAAEIKKAVCMLEDEYGQRQSGVKIIEIAGGYQMLSNPAHAPYIRAFYKTKHKEKLSKPALETLAIIAYKQPVTRVDVELIRGVNSDGVVAHLLSKELIKAVGRKDIPGRPFLYGTTKQFMEYFGLKSLDDLPRLEEFPGLVPPEMKEEDGLNDDARREEEARRAGTSDDAVEENGQDMNGTKPEAVLSSAKTTEETDNEPE